MSFLRPYHPSDLPWLYRICLGTGDSGQDATDHYQDPDLLGHLYAAPYAVYEPELCLILTQDSAPVGYILGTADSDGFAARCEADWYPHLRRRYPLPDPNDESPDARLIRLIHGNHAPENELAAYPAHLHIDLLPQAQGQGWGRRMILAFEACLRAAGARAVHLGVGKANTRALGFYEHCGFNHIADFGTWVAYGKRIEG